MDSRKYLSEFKSLWKTSKALDMVEDMSLWYDILKAFSSKCGKKHSKITWKDLADRVFSEYDRLYYANDFWYCRCITCGQSLHWTRIQCWHFISRAVMKYRYDITNCFPQCMRCNVILSGNYKNYTRFMYERFGTDKVNTMLDYSWTCNIKQQEFEDNIIKWYDFVWHKLKVIGK